MEIVYHRRVTTKKTLGSMRVSKASFTINKAGTIEPYQVYLVIGSSATLITGGLGWIMSMVKSNERRIRDLEIEVAVLKAVSEERKSRNS